MLVLLFLHFFVLKIFHFFVSLYKELLEPSSSASAIVVDNLCEPFGCSVITYFVSTMFGSPKNFGS